MKQSVNIIRLLWIFLVIENFEFKQILLGKIDTSVLVSIFQIVFGAR